MHCILGFQQERPNQYEQVLRAIGNIITDYDTDKLIPAFGFGAMNIPGGTDGRVADEFPLNGQPQSPYCTGVEGVIQVRKHRSGGKKSSCMQNEFQERRFKVARSY